MRSTRPIGGQIRRRRGDGDRAPHPPDRAPRPAHPTRSPAPDPNLEGPSVSQPQPTNPLIAARRGDSDSPSPQGHRCPRPTPYRRRRDHRLRGRSYRRRPTGRSCIAYHRPTLPDPRPGCRTRTQPDQHPHQPPLTAGRPRQPACTQRTTPPPQHQAHRAAIRSPRRTGLPRRRPHPNRRNRHFPGTRCQTRTTTPRSTPGPPGPRRRTRRRPRHQPRPDVHGFNSRARTTSRCAQHMSCTQRKPLNR